MAITSSAGDGVRITTAAYNEVSAGSQAQANGIDQIVFANNITTTNNGNLMASPTFTGRLVIIRQGTSTEETRYIISQAAGTGTTIIGTVNEAWVTAPAGTDTIHVSYIIQDAATLTGLSLISKRTDDYSMSRRFRIGVSGGATFGFFALLNGASLETNGPSSTTISDIIVETNARFDIGYLSSNNPVSGGAVYGAGGAGTADGNLLLDAKSGSEINFHDCYIKGVNNYKIVINGAATLVRVKIYKCLYTADLTGIIDLSDCSFEGVKSINETILVDETTDVASISLINNNGLLSRNDSVTETIDLYNSKFTGNDRFITTYSQKTWNVINPVWDVVTSSQQSIWFSGSTNSSVNEFFGVETSVATPNGTLLSGSTVYFYESLTNNSNSISGSTNVDGYYYDNVQLFEYLSGSPGLAVTATGDYYAKAYYYGRTPFIGPVDKSEGTNTTLFIALVSDNQISEVNQATAISNGSGITVTEYTTNPIKVVAYDGGTGTTPTLGETLGISNGASGVLIDYIGDEISGYAVLEWNGTEFTDNATLTGSVSSFSTLTDTTTFYSEYTWNIYCNDKSLQTTYDYISAKQAEIGADNIFSRTIEWGTTNYSKFMFGENNLFYTVSNNLQGVWISNYSSGDISYLTADDGTKFFPPATYTLTLTELEPGSQVVIVKNYETSPEEIYYDNSVAGTGESSYSYIYNGDVSIVVLVNSLTLENYSLSLTLSSADQTIPISQNVDRIYRND